MFITESTFIKTLEVLQEQSQIDKSYSILMQQVLSVDEIPCYDNSVLVNHLLLMLQNQFAPRDGVCEIERYCWELNFGYNDGVQVITPKNLYDAIVSDFPTYNKENFNNYHEEAGVHEIATANYPVNTNENNIFKIIEKFREWDGNCNSVNVKKISKNVDLFVKELSIKFDVKIKN